MQTYWIENETKIWDQHLHGKTTITGTVRVKYGEKLVYLVLKIIYLPLKSWKERVIVSKEKLSCFDHFNSTSFSVWKTIYSSKKPVTNTYPLSFWYWRITKISWHLAAYQRGLPTLTFSVPSLWFGQYYKFFNSWPFFFFNVIVIVKLNSSSEN